MVNKNPFFTIVVPVYKVENFISRCIKSIIEQSFKDFELLLIDDGSPDKSGDICDSFAQQDHRIYVIHAKNGGVSRARNKGIEQAKGQFILFIDADDKLFDNTTLEYIVQNIQNIQADIYQYVMSVSQQGKLNPIQNIQKLQCLDINTYRNMKKARGNAASYVFRNDLIQKYHIRFPEGVRISEDQAFTYSYFVYCDHIVLLPRPCYIYYVDENPNNSSKSRKNYSEDIRHHLNAIAYIITHLNICKKNGNHSIFRYDNFIGCFSADKIKMSARK